MNDSTIISMAKILSESEQKYNNLITKLYSASDVDDDDVVRIDTLQMSNILEDVFREQGLIKKMESE